MITHRKTNIKTPMANLRVLCPYVTRRDTLLTSTQIALPKHKAFPLNSDLQTKFSGTIFLTNSFEAIFTHFVDRNTKEQTG